MSRKFLMAVVFALAVLPFAVENASAFGVAAGDSIVNGIFVSTDTVPQAARKVSVAFTSTNTPNDTVYRGPTSPDSLAVAKAWDMDSIGDPGYTTAVAPGETASYPYFVKNTGNHTFTITLANSFTAGTGGINFGAGAYGFVFDNDNNNAYTSGETNITSITLPAAAADTVVAFVAAYTSRVDGDSTHALIIISDQADSPSVGTHALLGGPAGDGWEDSIPTGRADVGDTQVDTVFVVINAPNIFVDKDFKLTGTPAANGKPRPGDTIIYYLTLDNDGKAAATSVTFWDAIPTNTRYVISSADSVSKLGVTYSETTDYRLAYAHSLSGAFIGSEAETIAVIQWSLLFNLIADTAGGDAFGTANLDGDSDSVRAEFQVQVQ